jgi:hypothetical protein
MINKRSSWNNQFYHYPNASKFHNDVRDIFRLDDFFKNLHCYQEVPVSALVESYPNNKDFVDWYIDELCTVLELHGKQHYEQILFGYKPYAEAKKDFHNIQYRDNRKKTYLVDSGYNYVEISYKEAKLLSSEFLKTKILYESSS